jgi:hypothetical protein
MLLDFPVTGDIVISPNSKVKDEKGNDKYDLLECDGGVVDEGLHPVLFNILIGGDYTFSGDVISTLNETTSTLSLTWDGSHYWVSSSNGSVYKYTEDGSYTGISFSTNAQGITPTGIVWDGSHFWISDFSNSIVYKFTSGGDYANTSFNVSGELTLIRGVAWDGMYFWVVGRAQGDIDTVSQYNSDGSHTGFSFPVNNSTGIAWDEVNLWVVTTNTTVAEYSIGGVATGNVFSVASEDNNVLGLTSNKGSLVITGNTTDALYKYDLIKTLPDITSPSGSIPYKIAGDLT